MTPHTDDSHLTGFRHILPPAITAAFGACSAMFIVAYILHLPGLHLPGPVVGITLLLAIAGTLVTLVKAAGKPFARRIGTTAGFLTGLISLIAMGSAFKSNLENDSVIRLILMAFGWLAFMTIFGALAGGNAKIKAAEQSRSPHEWTPILGVITAISTLALLTMGGIVTAAEAGLAVPDWPATFGTNMFLYPLSKMTGGIYYEHAHRLMAAFVGLSTIALMTLCITTGKGKLLKALAVVAFVLVSIQGIAGALGVLLGISETSKPLTIFHGITAQLFFALILILTLISSSAWRKPIPAPSTVERKQFNYAIAAFAIVFLQVILGAVARHMPDSLHGVFTHAGFSLIAACAVVIAGGYASKLDEQHRLLRKLGKGSIHMLGLQMFLGVAALGIVMMTRDAETPPPLDLILTTTHQVVGALLFALIALLTVCSARALYATTDNSAPSADPSE